jgi:hypothetical protein
MIKLYRQFFDGGIMIIAERMLSIQNDSESKACRVALYAPENSDGM